MNSRSLFYIFVLILFVKLTFSVIIYYIGNDFFGGGNDSGTYHAYAIGEYDIAVNAWPVILRWLNNIGLYSRDGVAHFLKFLGFFVIPFLIAKLTYVKDSHIRSRIFWTAVIVISAYPTLIYFCTDIYRDVFMVFFWVIGLFVFQRLSQNPGFAKGALIFTFGLIIAYVLFEFRPYLGFGYLIALIFSIFYSFRRYSLFLSIFGVAIGLFILFCFGFLDPIINYRSIFNEVATGGSNLGITFSSMLDFFPDLVLTISFQLFGLFIVNFPSFLVFILESLPFILFFRYVIKNRKFSTKFVDYLILFFVAYSTIWLLGNDNLGTAVRLRIYSYISIFIAFCIIYQNKKIFLLKQKLNSKNNFSRPHS